MGVVGDGVEGLHDCLDVISNLTLKQSGDDEFTLNETHVRITQSATVKTSTLTARAAPHTIAARPATNRATAARRQAMRYPCIGRRRAGRHKSAVSS